MEKSKKFLKHLEQLTGVPILTVERTNGNHQRLMVSGCDRPFIVPLTPSDRRAVLNAAADIRRELRKDAKCNQG